MFPDHTYRALIPSRHQVRLLTILPESRTNPAGLIHCTLATFSLSDFSAKFLDYLVNSSHNPPYKTALTRGTQQQWIQHRTLLPNAAPPILSSLHSRQPPTRLHRFAWGDFSALSYVWGADTEDSPDNDPKADPPWILLNGRLRRVTRNLAAALAAFVASGEFDEAGALDCRHKLWVDALCINQADARERAREVGRMREIYGAAWSVVAWLGEASFGSDRALELLRNLGGLAKGGCEGLEVEAALREEPDYLGSGAWLALRDLMARPYWFRLWIFQEVVMGASATWLRCGSEWVDWGTFCEGVAFLEEHLWLVKNDLLRRERRAAGFSGRSGWAVGSLHLVYQDLTPLSRREEAGGTHPGFGQLLDIANSAACTEPKDKAYAMVGLMPPEVARRLEPDYNIDLSVAYTSVARTFIEVYDNLEPIREGNPWGPSGTPSWAADWQWAGRLRWSRPEGQLWGPTRFFPRQDPNLLSSVVYRASGDSKHDTVFSADGLRLTCNGCIIDRISGLSARGMGYFAWSKASVVESPNWISVYGDGNATREALCRTLVMDRVAGGEKASTRHTAIFHFPTKFKRAGPEFERRGWQWLAGQEGYYFRWAEFWAANSEMRVGSRMLGDFLEDWIPQDAQELDYSEVYSAFDRSSQKRRFMTTAGGYMGWAPDNIHGNFDQQTMEGDLIAILFGCSTPVVIRSQGSYFQILGEAYVQGLMGGEAMLKVQFGKIRTQTFTFC
jgi:hypothetical protein